MLTYLGHFFVLQTVRFGNIFGDGPHRQVLAGPQTIRRFQGQIVVFPKGLEENLLTAVYAPFVHRMQHRYYLIGRHYSKSKLKMLKIDYTKTLNKNPKNNLEAPRWAPSK